jgi:hypothetical protein
MSLLTEAHLLDKYGPLLTHDEVAAVLRMSTGTLRNRRSAGTIKLASVEGLGQIVFAAHDVAALIYEVCEQAKRPQFLRHE